MAKLRCPCTITDEAIEQKGGERIGFPWAAFCLQGKGERNWTKSAAHIEGSTNSSTQSAQIHRFHEEIAGTGVPGDIIVEAI